MSRKPILLLLCAFLLTIVGLPRTAQAQAGWKTEAVGKNAVMTPPDLAPGEFYQIIVFSRQSQGGAVITDFLDGFVDKDMAGRGKLRDKPEPAAAKNHTVASSTRMFVTPQGESRVAIYIAVSMDGENVRVMGIVSSGGGPLIRYRDQQIAVMKYVTGKEKTDAETSGRGLAVENLPTTPAGMTPGGKIVPGIYAGNLVDITGSDPANTSDSKINSRYRLYLYASGEFSLCDEKGEELRFGADTYSYDPITGKMAVGILFGMNNNSSDPDEEFCLYGRDANGKPYLHASDYRGWGWRTAILRYVGPTDRPSPKQLEAQKATARAEEERYKFVTAPGKGIQPAQIAGVFHNQISNLGDGPDKNEVYLLLKDGTIYDGLPVPPGDMDVSLSRRREPEKWGHWRRQGAAYAAAWPDQPNHFEPLQGAMTFPARAGERLAGRFGTGSTSSSMVTGGGWSLWGVTFSPGDRFLKDSRGGHSSGTLGATMNGVSVDTVYDDDGATTSFSTPGTVGYATRKKPGSHRGGTYSLSGYTLTLHYDDGRTARLPFFFTSPKRDQIYFEGANLALDTGK